MSITVQTWALIRRYLIALYRSPIRSFIRILLWPGAIISLVLILLINWKDDKDGYASHFHFEGQLPLITLLLTAFHVYHFSEWLVTDKATGFKSLMISMGLRRSSYYLGNSLCILGCVLPVVIIGAIISLLYLFPETNSSPVAIFVMFILFAIHLTGLTFALTSLITSTSLVVIIFLLLVLESFLHVGILFLMRKSAQSMQPIVLFFGSLSPYESIRIFASSYTLCKNCDTTMLKDDYVSQPMYLILIAMTFWSVAAFAFARWFDEVCPWQIDSAVKKPFFCCDTTKGYQELADSEENLTRDPKFFERSMAEREVGIRIINLTKVYRGLPVVDNLTFSIYRGETTLLLGHNGAGKTTLMDMILGKLTPSNGRVSIKNSNFEGGVGVCPQTSILDENLNVRQHLELFYDIKSSGTTTWERSSHIKTTIEDVSLTSHKHKLPSELSGGMKRKLSLAMAFVGKSTILILDEPSSGLDPDSRVFIWNAIRRYRADRTVLLSTQHMEEADYLGDRIAIMSAGKIICCGSSTFLNDALGSGYKLRVECNASKKSQVFDFVRKYFDQAKVSESAHNATPHSASSRKDPMEDIVIELIGDKSQDLELKMINLLEEIENNSSALGIKSHGLKSSSIEDVLLETDKSFNAHPQDSIQLTLTPISGHIETLAKPLRSRDTSFCASQKLFIYALIMKILHTYRMDWKSIILYRVLVATFGVGLLVHDLSSPMAFLQYTPSLFNTFMIFHLVYYPTAERVTKFKIMQLISHGNFVVYWLAQLVVDLGSILILIIGANIFLAIYLAGDFVVAQIWVHLLVSTSFLMFGLSASVLAYVLSTLLNDPKTSVGYVILIYCISTFVNLGITMISLTLSKDLGWLSNACARIFVAIFPTDALQFIFHGLATRCYINVPKVNCPETAGFSPVLLGLIALVGQMIVYSFVLYLIEQNNLDLTWYCNPRNIFARGASMVPGEQREVDKDVVDETNKALQLIKGDASRDAHSLIAADLNKSYTKGNKVIDHLSFTVNQGECFGLLGVNGAGKTTTFSMLATETKPDSGSIWMNGYYSTKNIIKYRHKLGYDPQSNPEMSLSPYQALYLMARLRRIEEHSIPMLVNSVLELLAMTQHASKPTRDLSGGTKRKLALGMSLIGNPALLALDEPTAGVDPIARRSVWQLLRSLRMQNGASIIISSHAMEECEAICDRISIMARGRLRCIGTFLHLRSKFSQGCRVKIQFSGVRLDIQPIISSLNQRLEQTIGQSVRLADTNVNSATFNITDNRVKRSYLFKILREFKQNHPNMCYMVNDSSLEDIFIALAREQQQLDQGVGVVTNL